MIETLQVALTVAQILAFIAAVLNQGERDKPRRWLLVFAFGVPVWILEALK